MKAKRQRINCDHFRAYLLALSTFLVRIGIVLGQDESTIEKLRKIQSARRGLVNYRCSTEYIQTASYESRKRKWQIARQSADLPARALRNIEKSLQGIGKTYELQNIVADASGRIKANSNTGDFDNTGQRQPARRFDLVWDGETGIQHSNYLDRDTPGGAVISSKKHPELSIMRHPLRIFGGHLLAELDEAIDRGESIELEQNMVDGTWQLSFTAEASTLDKEDCSWKCTIDPSKNFSITSVERLIKEGNSYSISADYQEMEDNVWFPVNGRIESFYPDGVKSYTVDVTITNIVINDPNLGKKAFHFDIPKGAHVRDTVAGVAYIVGDPSSVRRLGEPLGSTRAIVHDAVQDPEQKRGRIIFIPHIRRALKSNDPFVLDLKTRELLSVDQARGTGDVLKRLKGAGIGDLLWDNGLVLVEGVRMKPLTGENQRLIEPVEIENGKLYKFHDDVSLPCTLTVIDEAGISYRLTVRTISRRGISLTCEIVGDK